MCISLSVKLRVSPSECQRQELTLQLLGGATPAKGAGSPTMPLKGEDMLLKPPPLFLAVQAQKVPDSGGTWRQSHWVVSNKWQSCMP